MKGNEDKVERLKYLNEEKGIQESKKEFYLKEIEKLKKILEKNKEEVKYNEGWINFHNGSAGKHKKNIQGTIRFEEKEDQLKKLKFHINQIENHHKEYIKYHDKEISFLIKELQLFEEGIIRCNEQIGFLNKKMEENSK